MINKEFFIQNRRTLQKKVENNALIVITAQSLLQRSADTTYPFRQDSNFFYFTGIELPDVVLVMSGTTEFLILPKRSEVETIFGGFINRDEVAKKSGISEVLNFQEGWEKYKKLQQNRKNIFSLNQAPPKVSGIDSFFTNPARRMLLQKLRRLNKSAVFRDLRPIISGMRQVKQREEIEVLQEAIAITAKGFAAAHELLQKNTTENTIEASFDSIFKKHLSNHGYQPIVASAERACVLHYVQNNQPISTHELCLLDVGAEVSNYSADISRTYSAAMSVRQKEIVDAVKSVQEQAIALLQPNIAWKDFANEVQLIMGQTLMSLGLITNITPENVHTYFPHAISHSLGLDVHDVCDYTDIKEHMVITVEPGIYIPEEGIGVRIEDNILITNTGAQNLSEMIPYY